MMSFTLVSVALFAAALAFPTSNVVLHEKRDEPWANARQRVDRNAIIPIRIALRQSNLETGYDRLMDVSHPSSVNYGRHLSAQEVHDIFAPAEDTLRIVKDWLLNSGVHEDEVKHYSNKGWLAIDVPAHRAERLLATEYYEYALADSTIRMGCDAYHLPADVSDHVDFIKPGVKMSAPLKRRTVKRQAPGWPVPWPRPPHHPPHQYPHWHPPPHVPQLPPDLQACSVNITPPCIKALYQIPPATVADAENVMGLYESGDFFAQRDIDLFFKHFAPNVPQGTSPRVLSVDGGEAPVPAHSPLNGGESDIDLDLTYSLIYPQSVTIYQVDDLPNSLGLFNKSGFLNTFLDAVDGSYCNYTAYGITGDSPKVDATYPDPKKDGFKGQLECGIYSLTRVVSISYGEEEIAFPKRYVERQCNEFMKLGLQGHSFFVASGDYGVASFPHSDHNTYGCISRPGLKAKIYNPDYPCGCPYITSVGATRLYPNDTVYDPESAMQVNLTALSIESGNPPGDPAYQFFASGGGFSNFFTPPSYQAAAVSSYLASHDSLPYYIANEDASNIGENGGLYNRGGRGYPDVSSNGAFLLAYTNLTEYQWFGTSLASPTFASIITLINEQRTLVGKGPVGFVNPVLYENPQVLNDITNGSNPNCGSSGFQTSTGWDPVTGLGTANYPRMLDLFMSLP